MASGNRAASVVSGAGGMDTGGKVVSRFMTQTGRVTKYTAQTCKYTVRPHMAPFSDVFCCALVTGAGAEAPYAVNDLVVLHFYPAVGWAIMGKLSVPRNRLTKPQFSDEKGRGAETREISYRDPDDTEKQFHAEDGDHRVSRGESQMIMSRVGVWAAKVAHDCARYMSKTGRLIRDTCYNYVLSLPRMIFDVNTTVESGEPSVKARIQPQNPLNEIKLKMGGSITDAGADGLQATMGSLFRLAISMLPGDTQLELIQNTTTIKMNLSEFLLQFGEGTFRFNETGLVVVKGGTQVSLDATSLAIVTQALTLTLETLTVNASGAVVVNGSSVMIQSYTFLTVIERLNRLLLSYALHTHGTAIGPTDIPNGDLPPILTPEP